MKLQSVYPILQPSLTFFRCLGLTCLFLIASCNTEKSVIENAFAPGSSIKLPSQATSVSVEGAATLKIDWAPASAPMLSYKVFRSEEFSGPYVEIFSTSAVLTYTDSGLTPGEDYFYKVEYHSGASVSVTTPSQGIPIADFTITSITASNSRVDFVFPSVAGATSYSLRYGTAPGVYGLEMPITSGAHLLGLINGTTYYFQIKAKNSFGGVDSSAEVATLVQPLAIDHLEFSTAFAPTSTSADSAFTTQAIIKARDADGNLEITDSYSVITLRAYDAFGCAGAEITSGLSGTLSKTLVNGVATFTDVRATKVSVKSIEASLGTIKVCSGNLTVTPGAPSQILITGGDNQSSTLATALTSSLTVLVRDAQDNVTPNTSVNWAASSGTLGGASSLTNASGVASNSLTLGSVAGAQTVSATINGTSTTVTFAVTATVAAPTALTGTIGNTSAALSFTGATGATSYNIYRSTTSGSGHTLVTNIATTSYTNSSLTNGTTYYFIVKAVNNSIESSASNEVSVRPAVAPTAPGSFAGTLASTQTVLTWSAPTTGTTPLTYTVYRSTTSGSGYTEVEDEIAGLTFTDTGLANGTTYYYKVTANNTLGEGPESDEIAITPDFTTNLRYDFAGNSTFQPHNLMRYSEAFNGPNWTKAQTVIKHNATMAPDGTFTADKITATAVSSDHYVQQSIAVQANVTYTISVYLKKAERTTASVYLGVGSLWAGGTLPGVSVNLLTGTITTSSAGSNATMTPVGNGWYRVSISGTPIANGNSSLRVQYSNSGTGNEINGFYAWGAQAEANHGVSRYVRTLGTTQEISFANPLEPIVGTVPLTFSRADSSPIATVYGSDGLLRMAPHNRINRSQELDSWTKARVLVENDVAIAPDGTMTAEKIIESTSIVGGTDHAVYRSSLSIEPGGVYTFSIFLKAAERTKCHLRMGDSSWTNTYRLSVDLATGQIASTTANGSITLISKSMVHVGNSWYRVSLSTQLPPANTSAMASVYVIDAAGNSGYTGDGISGFYAWGGQYEKNTSPSTYVPTSTASLYGSPRFDFDPAMMRPKGLLMEAAQTNLLTYSEQINHADWNGITNATVTPDVSEAPNGTITADKIVEDTTASSNHKVVRGNVAITTGTTYTGSAFFKTGERARVTMQLAASTLWTTSNPRVSVNVSTCTVTATAYALHSSATNVGRGWCRVTLTQTAIGSGNSGLNFNLMDSSNSEVYTGDGVSGLYVWGAQLEASQYASSYIPTLTATVTRAAELNSADASAWLNPNTGTLLTQFTEGGVGSMESGRVIELNSGSSANRIVCGGRTSSGIFVKEYVAVSSVGVAGLYGYAAGVSGPANSKLGCVYGNNDYATSLNASAVTTNSVGGTPPPVNTLFVGKANSNSGYLNGWIQGFSYYNTRLPDADLVRLTQ